MDDEVALLSSLRKRNGGSPLLHASISCKLTIRSDRSQNSRSEALNLIRNRRGKLPHVVVVTAEPLPSRLASVALGSGDIDCVYHFALPELCNTVKELGLGDSQESLNIMVNGKRLKDISDLPLDLAVCRIDSRPSAVLKTCGAFEPRIPNRNYSSGGSFMQWASAFGCMSKRYRAAPIWFLFAGEKSFWCMAAFGIVTGDAKRLMCRKLGEGIGVQNLKGTGGGIPRTDSL